MLCVTIAVGSNAAAAEAPLARAEGLVSVLDGAPPTGPDELRAMQDHIRSLTEQLISATVAVQVGVAQGSGVIINREGYVLTAAHVIGSSGRAATIYLHDGRRVTGKTLGTFRTMDAGLLKIDEESSEEGGWPHAVLGDSSRVALGQWCLALGHPGGIHPSREPTLRLGRILSINADSALTTDCTLIGGDSGGPLFNMQGHVIGIHSRIGGSLTTNLHVPSNTYREVWTRLREGEDWGHTPGQTPYLGVQGVADSPEARISRVYENSPAEKAGIRKGDLVVSFAGHSIRDFDSLRRYVSEQEPGTKVTVTVVRGGKRLDLEAVVGRIRE